MSDDKIGYRNPPKHTRFKKGVSGNPKGRPKSSNNLKTDLGQELSERVYVRENGRQIAVSKQRLLIKALTAKAVKGDTRAAALLINLLAQTFGLDPQPDQAVELTPSDDAIIEIFQRRLVSGAARKPLKASANVGNSSGSAAAAKRASRKRPKLP